MTPQEALAQAMEAAWPTWTEEAPSTEEGREEIRHYATAIFAAIPDSECPHKAPSPPMRRTMDKPKPRSPHLVKHQYKKGETPSKTAAYCYICRGVHTWAQGCPTVYSKERET